MLRIYNTISRSVEDFVPLNPQEVSIYSCGPTVYDYAHIGHMRTYTGTDILLRVLKQNGFSVHHVMNITDVGHLTSDADSGEDKMEKGSKKFGMSVWDIAKKFEQQFKDSCNALSIKLPKDLMHATDYVEDQIKLVKTLEEKGYTYKTDDGIYFDTSKFKDYFKLSRQNKDELKAGARVEVIEGKRNITDFALWKFSPENEKRQMEWQSPWGVGFPGWHIECSAMSMKALGESFDIHTGGVDHINIHHTNEIAQSEAATGKQFVKYWVHFNHLLVDGEKMSKSLGNFYTVQDIIKKSYDPIALRYLYLQTHWRQEMNFTWQALEAAQNALNKLRNELLELEAGSVGQDFKDEFLDALNNDLNTPKALAILWENLKKGLSKDSLLWADEVFGLDLLNYKHKNVTLPQSVKKLLEERQALRKERKYSQADEIRDRIIEMGYKVEDN